MEFFRIVSSNQKVMINLDDYDLSREYATFYRYKMYKRMVTVCRRKCKTEAAGSSPIFAEDIEDLHFYERKVRETLCLMKCNQDYREIAGAEALKRLPHVTEKKFADFTIYEYLQICYFQVRKRMIFLIINNSD